MVAVEEKVDRFGYIIMVVVIGKVGRKEKREMRVKKEGTQDNDNQKSLTELKVKTKLVMRVQEVIAKGDIVEGGGRGHQRVRAKDSVELVYGSRGSKGCLREKKSKRRKKWLGYEEVNFLK